jgi:hypothetical protein
MTSYLHGSTREIELLLKAPGNKEFVWLHIAFGLIRAGPFRPIRRGFFPLDLVTLRFLPLFLGVV